VTAPTLLDRTGAGLLLALVSAVTFGLSGPFAKALTDAGWSASGAVLVRLGGAAAILLVVLAVRRPGVLAAIHADGPALVLAGVGMTVGAVVVALLGLVGVLPIVIDTAATGVLLAGVDVGWPVAATLLVVVASVIAYLTGVAAIARIGAARGSLVALLEVVASAVASWLLLGQVPAATQLAGGALILAGVALTSTAARPEPAAAPA
jgi:drug/metabolite transporter (DMT)-like permease